jgi:hypothetical protein
MKIVQIIFGLFFCFVSGISFTYIFTHIEAGDTIRASFSVFICISSFSFSYGILSAEG